MKQYERDLKQLIARSDGGCKRVHQRHSGLDEKALRFMSAQGLISLVPGGDNEFWIIVEKAGLTYFSDKAEARGSFIKNHAASFLTGFASGVLSTLAATWLMQTVLR